MSSRILQGDVFDMLPTIAAGSVDCCVTSPPYWFLRSYLPKDHPLKSRELGSEPTPAEYVANQVKVFRLVRDCLADHGTVWLNIGDSYSHDSRGGKTGGKHVDWHGNGSMSPGRTQKMDGIAAGNLCLIPQRLAIALQDDGWLVRSIVIWHKPACMPASLSGWMWVRCRVKVKGNSNHDDGKNGEHPNPTAVGFNARYVDPETHSAQWSDCPGCKKCKPHGGYVLRRGSWRPTSSYEPILMLAKKPGYYCDGIAVETLAKASTTSRDQYTRVLDDPDEEFAVQHDHETQSKTANLRDVWTIAAEALKQKHYAAFPTELVRRCLKAGTSEKGYCPTCGKPWARVVDKEPSPVIDEEYAGKNSDTDQQDSSRRMSLNSKARREAGGHHDQPFPPSRTLGWRQTCSCPPHEPRPALVLDPFAGSGRTGVTAQRMFLDFVGCELNPAYADMATKILKDDCPLFS